MNIRETVEKQGVCPDHMVCQGLPNIDPLELFVLGVIRIGVHPGEEAATLRFGELSDLTLAN